MGVNNKKIRAEINEIMNTHKKVNETKSNKINKTLAKLTYKKKRYKSPISGMKEMSFYVLQLLQRKMKKYKE